MSAARKPKRRSRKRAAARPSPRQRTSERRASRVPTAPPPVGRVWDVSRPIGETTRAWPGDLPFTWRSTASLAEGAPFESTAFTMSAHLGTHADAPSHVVAGGATIGEVPLSAYIGEARVVHLGGRGEIGPDTLPRTSLGRGRVLFKSGGRAFLSPLAAVRLAESGVILLGTDALSIDPPDAEDLPAHRALLSRGVALLEWLNLSEVEPGEYRLVALPLRFLDLDASPVRAILTR